MPKNAVVISSSGTCPIASFHIGDKVYTTQNHPKMTPEFVAALVTEYAPKLPAGVAATVKSSIAEDADT